MTMHKLFEGYYNQVNVVVYCPLQAYICGVSFVLTIDIQRNDRYRKTSFNIYMNL